MNRRRILPVAAVGLCAALWTYACGDGTTEPDSPQPDPPRATMLTVTPATIQLTAVGATAQLTAEVRDQNGQVMAGATVTWSSSAAAVATVDASGLVTAAGNGTATITASAGSASGTATVTVAQEVSAVAVSPAADTLVAGDTLRLSAVAADANDHAIEGVEFAWASSDTLVAVVDSAGLVTAAGRGRTTITATAGEVSGEAVVTVMVAEVPVARVVMSVDSASLTVRTRIQLTALLLSSTGDTLSGRSIAWATSDTAVAVVSSTGTAIAVGAGTASIMASSESQQGSTAITASPSELEIRGVYVQFEKRGWPSGYWSGDLIKHFTEFDSVVGHTIAEEVSQQLDAMRTIGVNTITFELRSADSVWIPGPREPPECNVSPDIGLLWPNPAEEHLANLVSFLDLVQSKGMRVLLRLVNTRMDDRYRAEAEMWLGAILASIRGHPALELVLFEGDQRYHDTDGDGVVDSCGHEAEPPLWFGPDGVGGRYVEWAIEYALSLGFAPQKLSAEAVIGGFRD